MSSSNFAEAIVLSTVQLTPHMYRLTFRSEFAADFTLGAPGQYLKVLAPAPGEAGPPAFDPNTYKTQMRTYTLRHARPAEQEFDIDFVVHGDEGIAGPWAKQARSGDRILISRPGTLKFTVEEADWHL
ncbi:siderophore-interacting protein, partial [Hyphomonas atlantica]|uniref:siderophore-interacting protein n=1 Tax=Hyphomonas atlantica TaxID=1280948 RepID=UPI0032B111D8